MSLYTSVTVQIDPGSLQQTLGFEDSERDQTRLHKTH